MFDDKATEVNELTFVVKQNLGRSHTHRDA